MDTPRMTRSWAMLALGTCGQTASTTALYGLAYLIPAFQRDLGVSLAGAGLLVSCPIAGILLGLVGWGAVADRYGERLALTAGLFAATAAMAAAAAVAAGDATLLGLLLVAAGAGGSSVNSASGRLVIGWFPPGRRGMAMGVRQASQPVGTAVAAAALPPLADGAGVGAAFGLCAGLCGVTGAAIAVFAVDPPRPGGPGGPVRREQPGGPVPVSVSRGRAVAARPPSPYRRSAGGGHLWRLHAVAAALCVPQFVVTGFALLFLTQERGWSAAAAGTVLAAVNLAGAGVRLLAGWWSDAVGSRVRPMRWLAVATAADLALLAAGAVWPSAAGTAALLAASALTISTNGLHNTAVAECAGPDWAGRALGVHGTGQHVAIVLVPPLAGALITGFGFAPAFASAALAAVLAVAVLPRADGAARWAGPGAAAPGTEAPGTAPAPLTGGASPSGSGAAGPTARR
ncbi:MFS transporter [Streptomyces sp. 2P-4]|uniref:MFS transporter n=1 Tax=Streptomyces sp. 2P-4 TaxID=2931974 RepID=UPI0025423EE2|nr:MFS transporter [Streptomyces sp. 2P-4]